MACAYTHTRQSEPDLGPDYWGDRSAQDCCETSFQRPRQRLAHRALLEALDELGEEALDDQAGGDVLLGRVEVHVLAAGQRVGAGHLALGALALQQGVLEDLAVAGAEAEDDPIELAVAGDAGALGAEDPRLLVEALAGDEAQLGVL